MEETIEPPNFQLQDFNPSRHELWSVRIPADLSLKSLKNITIEGDSVDTDEGPLTIHFGGVESQSFRILLKEDDSHLYPSQHRFTRHVDIVRGVAKVSALDLAPRADKAPEPKEPVRHAYSHVPQRQNLKRRWKPIGGGKAPPSSTTTAESTKSNATTGTPATRKRSNSQVEKTESSKKHKKEKKDKKKKKKSKHKE